MQQTKMYTDERNLYLYTLLKEELPLYERIYDEIVL